MSPRAAFLLAAAAAALGPAAAGADAAPEASRASSPAAAAPSPRSASWIGFGTMGGAIVLDPHLHDYRWDTSPRAIFGFQGMLVRDRIALGARVWSSRTSQATGLLEGAGAPSVRLTGAELVAEPHLASWSGFRCHASATGGIVHLGWSPDRLTLDASGGGEAITVDFEPVDTWTASAGLGVRRALPGRVMLGVAVERSIFSLETAHRVDDVIVEDRELFGNWTVRVELSRWFISI